MKAHSDEVKAAKKTARKAAKIAAKMTIKGADDINKQEVGRKSSGDSFLDLGTFANGTPVSEESLREWNNFSRAEKVSKNMKRLEQLVIPWNRVQKSTKSTRAAGAEDVLGREKEEAYDLANHQRDIGGKSMLLFTHIPKVGGTTFEYLLSKNYRINRTLHINNPELEKRPYLLFKHSKLTGVIMGHHRVDSILYQMIDCPIMQVTMLREPISRIISYYNYKREAKDKGHNTKDSKVSKMTLAEFVESDEFFEVVNGQALRLTGKMAKDLNHSQHSHEETLEEAKMILRDRMSIFGITEQYAKFLVMLKRTLKWQDIYYLRQNVTKQKTERPVIDPSIIQTMRKRNAIDVALYDYAKNLFEERCEELGIDQADVDRYESNNKIYQGILSESYR
jgi:hypothetical protein